MILLEQRLSFNSVEEEEVRAAGVVLATAQLGNSGVIDGGACLSTHELHPTDTCVLTVLMMHTGGDY